MTSKDTIAETLAADCRFTIFAQALRPPGLTPCSPEKGPIQSVRRQMRHSRRSRRKPVPRSWPTPKDRLFRILQYHIMFGNLSCSTIKKLNFPKTRLGITVEITEKGGQVLFGGAPVTIPDIACTNGVIHGIGGVVIPR